eukprot:TRINITY_DN2866_c0_g1_i2.p1 TRINITY_DN2866_c0_g1~~TRINITY_DN2866_c0_g1_i2.p1  ORF type:complete len:107 (+),score=9.24 TRINITY_DN2866_c0_g1_i2:156-476(+)
MALVFRVALGHCEGLSLCPLLHSVYSVKVAATMPLLLSIPILLMALVFRVAFGHWEELSQCPLLHSVTLAATMPPFCPSRLSSYPWYSAMLLVIGKGCRCAPCFTR